MKPKPKGGTAKQKRQRAWAWRLMQAEGVRATLEKTVSRDRDTLSLSQLLRYERLLSQANDLINDIETSGY